MLRRLATTAIGRLAGGARGSSRTIPGHGARWVSAYSTTEGDGDDGNRTADVDAEAAEGSREADAAGEHDEAEAEARGEDGSEPPALTGRRAGMMHDGKPYKDYKLPERFTGLDYGLIDIDSDWVDWARSDRAPTESWWKGERVKMTAVVPLFPLRDPEFEDWEEGFHMHQSDDELEDAQDPESETSADTYVDEEEEIAFLSGLGAFGRTLSPDDPEGDNISDDEPDTKAASRPKGLPADAFDIEREGLEEDEVDVLLGRQRADYELLKRGAVQDVVDELAKEGTVLDEAQVKALSESVDQAISEEELTVLRDKQATVGLTDLELWVLKASEEAARRRKAMGVDDAAKVPEAPAQPKAPIAEDEGEDEVIGGVEASPLPTVIEGDAADVDYSHDGEDFDVEEYDDDFTVDTSNMSEDEIAELDIKMIGDPENLSELPPWMVKWHHYDDVEREGWILDMVEKGETVNFHPSAQNANISDYSKTLMFVLHTRDPDTFNVEVLARSFKIRQQRVMAILALKKIQYETEQAGEQPMFPDVAAAWEEIHGSSDVGADEKHIRIVPKLPKFMVIPEGTPPEKMKQMLPKFVSDEEKSAREEKRLVKEFKEYLDYNLKITGPGLQRGGRIRKPAKRPEGGWGLMVIPIVTDNSKKTNRQMRRAGLSNVAPKPYVAYPDGTKRDINDDEKEMFRRRKIKPFRRTNYKGG